MFVYIKRWTAAVAVPGFIFAEVEILSALNGFPLHSACHPDITVVNDL